MNRRTAPRICAALLSTALLAACGAPAPEAVATPRAVRSAVVEAGPAEPPIVATGVLAARNEASLAFRTGGIVRALTVRAGDSVRQGQLLAEIETAEVDAGLAQAQAADDKAQRDLARGRQLHADDVLTREQLDDLGTAAKVARAQLDAARYTRERSSLRAAADGVVLRRLVEEREMVAAGQPVLAVSEAGSGLVLKLGLADRAALRVRRGDRADVQFDAYPQQRFAARVVEISRAADPRTGTFAVDLALDPPDRQATPLPSGLIGTATIDVQRGETQLAYVPLAALVEGDANRVRLFVLDGAQVREQDARLRFISGDRAALDAGPAPGARVVTDGAAYLRDGDTVRVVD